VLLVGEEKSCQRFGEAVEGQYANVGSVVGTPPGGLPDISAADPSHYRGYVPVPSLDLEVSVNGNDADSAPGLFILAGDPITFTFDILNSGNVTLTNVSLIDDQGTPEDPADDLVFCEVDELASFETRICEVSGLAGEGQIGHSSVVTGTFETQVYSDADQTFYFGAIPAVEIQKLTNGEDADDPIGPVLSVGDPVTWTYHIRNTGNITLTNLVIQDNVLGPVCEIDELPPYAPAEICEKMGVVNTGQYANLGTVTAIWPAGSEIDDSDWSHYFGLEWVYLPIIINE
jgi:hypothetical protein